MRIQNRPERADIASWGSGEPIPGTPFRQIVTGAQTGGRLVLLAVDMPVGERVDEHTHDDEDQITIVISGSVGATVGDREVRLDAGSAFFFPRGIPHSQSNAGTDVARVLEIYTPSGFEKVFERAGAAGAFDRAATPDDFAQISSEPRG